MEKLSNKTREFIDMMIKEDKSLAREFNKNQTKGLREIYSDLIKTFSGREINQRSFQIKDLSNI
jgi:hypothetical protein